MYNGCFNCTMAVENHDQFNDIHIAQDGRQIRWTGEGCHVSLV